MNENNNFIEKIFKLNTMKCEHGYDHHGGAHACDNCEDNECPYWAKIVFLERKYLK